MLTVITPAETQLLASVTDTCAELGLGDDQQASVATVIKRASAAIARYCARPFGRETVRERLRPFRSGAVILERRPAVRIVSILVDGQALDPAETECNSETGLLFRLQDGEPGPWRGSSVTVTYEAGWILPGPSDADLPEDIREACLLLVTAWHADRGRNPLLRSESEEGIGSSSWLDPRAGMEAMPPQVAGLLKPYRRVFIA
jgi:hypothetical protein